MVKQTMSAFFSGGFIAAVFSLLPRFFGAINMGLTDIQVKILVPVFLFLFLISSGFMVWGIIEERNKEKNRINEIKEAVKQALREAGVIKDEQSNTTNQNPTNNPSK